MENILKSSKISTPLRSKEIKPESIDVISKALHTDVLTQEQILILMEELMGALLRKNFEEMENLFNVEEIRKEPSPLEVEMEFFDEFFERIRRYFEKMLLLEE